MTITWIPYDCWKILSKRIEDVYYDCLQHKLAKLTDLPKARLMFSLLKNFELLITECV